MVTWCRTIICAVQRRLTDIAAVLSLAGDLGHGAPPEHQLRVGVLAARLAVELGLTDDEQRDSFDVAVLRWLGCTATAQPLSAWMGDEVEAHRRAARFAGPVDPLLEILRHAGAGLPLLARLGVLASAMRAGPAVVFGSACEASTHMAGRLGYGPGVVAALGVAFERFDGRGWPGRVRADAIPVAAQVAMITEDLTTLTEFGDHSSAVEEVGRRAGKHYDPAVVAALTRVAGETAAELEGADAWVLAGSCDPAPERRVPADRVTETLVVVADFVDIKVPGMAGHSRAVAELAAGAAAKLGATNAAVDNLRHAALLHDLGRVTVSNAVWNQPGPLSSADREHVRLCPYRVERFCARSSWLAPLGALGALHQERLDGSGYHRGLAGAALARPARILAAAVCFRAMLEERAHRPASTPAQAATTLRAEASAGRLDPDVVEAVIAAAGQRARARKAYPAGLTGREVEVLGLLAQGLPNKQIAATLVVSARTVGHHVEHIYDKIGVATRAGATLFALRNDLVETSGG